MQTARYSWLVVLLVLGLSIGLVGCFETEEDDDDEDDRTGPVGPGGTEQMEISQPGMNFYAGAGPAVCTLSYTGDDTCYWTATPQDAWIGVDPTSGMLTADDDEVTLTVSLDRRGMDPGNYEGSITISSVDQTIDFYVKMIVEETPEPEEVEILNWGTTQQVEEGYYVYSEEYENEYQMAEYRVEFEVTEITGSFAVELILLNGSSWTTFTNGVSYHDHGSLLVTSPGTYELTSDVLIYNESFYVVVDYSDLGDAQTDGGATDHVSFTLTAWEKQVLDDE